MRVSHACPPTRPAAWGRPAGEGSHRARARRPGHACCPCPPHQADPRASRTLRNILVRDPNGRSPSPSSPTTPFSSRRSRRSPATARWSRTCWSTSPGGGSGRQAAHPARPGAEPPDAHALACGSCQALGPRPARHLPDRNIPTRFEPWPSVCIESSDSNKVRHAQGLLRHPRVVAKRDRGADPTAFSRAGAPAPPDRFQGRTRCGRRSSSGDHPGLNVLVDPERRAATTGALRPETGATGADPRQLAKIFLQRGIKAYKDKNFFEAADSFDRAPRPIPATPGLAPPGPRCSQHTSWLDRAVTAIEHACEISPMNASYQKLPPDRGPRRPAERADSTTRRAAMGRGRPGSPPGAGGAVQGPKRPLRKGELMLRIKACGLSTSGSPGPTRGLLRGRSPPPAVRRRRRMAAQSRRGGGATGGRGHPRLHREDGRPDTTWRRHRQPPAPALEPAQNGVRWRTTG